MMGLMSLTVTVSELHTITYSYTDWVSEWLWRSSELSSNVSVGWPDSWVWLSQSMTWDDEYEYDLFYHWMTDSIDSELSDCEGVGESGLS